MKKQSFKRVKIQIAYQGQPGAFSHMAALSGAGQIFRDLSLELCPRERFSEVFDDLASDRLDFAFLPFENSSIGAILENYHLFLDLELLIGAEFYMPIRHQLLALKGARLEKIKKVYSHPVALAQCQKLFARQRNLQAISYSDTAAAAQYVKSQGKKELAAIASELASEMNDLFILQKNIEDFENNCTRFLLLAKNEELIEKYCHSQISEFPAKLSLLCNSDKNGSLNEIFRLTQCLGPGVRLLSVQAVPIPELAFRRRLVLDFELDSSLALAKFQSEEIKSLFRFLGLYKSLRLSAGSKTEI